MPSIVNAADFFKIGIMAFLFVLFVNSFLRKMGMNSFTTSGE